MKKIISFLKNTALCLTAAVMLFGLSSTTELRASAETVSIGEMEYEGELIAVFSFDKEKPDITLVSPSGTEYTETSSGVQFAEGDNWCTFKIENAEVGAWQANYEKGSNTEVNVSVMNGTEAIAIQAFDIMDVTGTNAEIQFSAELANLDDEYLYTVSIVTEKNGAAKELMSSSAKLGEINIVDVDLSSVSSFDGYMLLLEVNYLGENESVDYAYSREFNYTNPNQSDSLADFKLKLDSAEGTVYLDWYDYTEYGVDGYAVVCYLDGNKDEPFFTSDVTTDSELSFSYPFDSKKLEISLYKSVDGVLSLPVTKTVDLENSEYLKINAEEITNSAQVEIAYNASAESLLTVTLGDGQTQEYTINGESIMAVSLAVGANSIYCEFVGQNNITYCATKDVYYSFITPEIILYENLSGKYFNKGTITVMGKVKNAAKLTVNGNEVTLNENGEFSFDAQIKENVNNYLVEAESPSGVKTSQNIELKLKSGSASILSSQSYLPLIISLCSSAVIIILGFVFLKKNKDGAASKGSNPKTNRIILVICDILAIVTEIIAVVKFIALYKVVNGAEFIEIAESSAAKALKFLNAETRGGIIIIALGVLIILLEIVTIVSFRAKNKTAKTPKAKKSK